MASDRLAELLVPNLIEQFDAIPPDQPISIQLTKGEVAYLIKSHYQLHNGLALLITALGDALFGSEVGTRAMSEASLTLQGAQNSLANATNPMIERIVRAGGRSS